MYQGRFIIYTQCQLANDVTFSRDHICLSKDIIWDIIIIDTRFDCIMFLFWIGEVIDKPQMDNPTSFLQYSTSRDQSRFGKRNVKMSWHVIIHGHLRLRKCFLKNMQRS
jgi:hypothetical protein